MDLYEAIYNRRIVRDFEDKSVSDDIIEKIIDAGLQAPTHDHLRNWEFVVIKDNTDKESVLQFIRKGVEPQLEILKQTLVSAHHSKKCMLLLCQDSILCCIMLRILFCRFSNLIQEL